MDDHDAYRRSVIHRVFTGVNTNDTDLVSDALGEFEVETFKRGYSEGYLKGVLFGALLGAVAAIVLIWAAS